MKKVQTCLECQCYSAAIPKRVLERDGDLQLNVMYCKARDRAYADNEPCESPHPDSVMANDVPECSGCTNWACPAGIPSTIWKEDE